MILTVIVPHTRVAPLLPTLEDRTALALLNPLSKNREAGWFHTIREKLKPGIKASPPVGERFGEGSKSMTQNDKSGLMYFSFFV
jgi:hypothetical protein